MKKLEDSVEGDWLQLDCFTTESGLKIYIDYSPEKIIYFVSERYGDVIRLQPCLYEDLSN